MRRTLKYSMPGALVGVVALVVALGGTSIAGGGAQTAAKPRVKPQVTQVTQTVNVPTQCTNFGILDVTVNCPAGTLVVGGGAVDPTAEGARGLGRDLEPVQQMVDGPSGNGWRFQVDNDSPNETLPLSLTAICLRDTLRVKGLKK